MNLSGDGGMRGAGICSFPFSVVVGVCGNTDVLVCMSMALSQADTTLTILVHELHAAYEWTAVSSHATSSFTLEVVAKRARRTPRFILRVV